MSNIRAVSDFVQSRNSTFDMVKILCNQRKGLSVCHINAQSLTKKLDEFRYIFENSHVDIICVSEAWFWPDYSDEFVSLNGYKLFRDDRPCLGGGVVLYIRKNIKCSVKFKSEPGDRLEYIFVDVYINTIKSLIGVIYKPHRSVDMSYLFEQIANASSMYSDVIITGNVLMDNSQLNNFLSVGLSPVNNSTPTHFTSTSSTLLDVFLVNNMSKILLYDQLSTPCFSKHDLIFLI